MTKTADMQVFLNRVEPLLERLERVRLKMLAQYIFRCVVGVLGVFCLFLAVNTADWKVSADCIGKECDGNFARIIMLMPVIVIASGVYWWVRRSKLDYARVYKEEILPAIADLLGNFICDVDGGIPLDELEASKLIPYHDCYKYGDYFEGYYKGVKVRFSEFYFEIPLWANKGMRHSPLFEGLAILINLQGRKFSGHTILVRNESRALQWLAEKIDGLKRVNLVDPNFAKMFSVYTNDQVEARYCVDPHIMECYKTLTKIFRSKTIMAAYYNDSLLIMIPSKYNFFEPAGIHVGAMDVKSLLRIKKEIEIILSIVDYLKLSLPER